MAFVAPEDLKAKFRSKKDLYKLLTENSKQVLTFSVVSLFLPDYDR